MSPHIPFAIGQWFSRDDDTVSIVQRSARNGSYEWDSLRYNVFYNYFKVSLIIVSSYRIADGGHVYFCLKVNLPVD